jgi:LuxR family transcriptional regulator, positive regulator of biofilm formation
MAGLSKTIAVSNAPHIFVVGPKRLQSEMMAYVLKRKTGVRCDTAANVSDVSLICGNEGGGINLLLLDCSGISAQPFVETAQAQLPESVLCLYNPEDDGALGQLIGKIKGLFIEGSSIDQLVRGIRAVLAGRLWLPREIIDRYILNPEGVSFRRREVSPLSRKETQILGMVATGVPNRLIASELGLSTHTVKTHLYKIFKKLNVSNRVQAAKWATENLVPCE